ncbi:hypothetical protein ACE7GA_08580 [Roseomonas sp. CCTCC AB2023176]|uniref:hypothetical protein n=1 Tax=Roseomonas sp. CCTCC AB2023176 TaxID=3342640 RepID=UPI0035D87F7A
MSSTRVTYERGTTYVRENENQNSARALVGTMTVGGYAFDTLERYSPTGLDYVHLPAGDHTRAVMYWWRPGPPDRKKFKTDEEYDAEVKRRAKNPGKRVINPWASAPHQSILVHYGETPSWWEGCIGPGWLARAGQRCTLTESADAMEFIFTLCGGTWGEKNLWDANAPRVCLRVVNAFPDRARLTAY